MALVKLEGLIDGLQVEDAGVRHTCLAGVPADEQSESSPPEVTGVLNPLTTLAAGAPGFIFLLFLLLDARLAVPLIWPFAFEIAVFCLAPAAVLKLPGFDLPSIAAVAVTSLRPWTGPIS